MVYFPATSRILNRPVSPKVSQVSDAHSVTQLLEQWNHGDRDALDKLMPLIYDELRKMAKRYMSQQNPGHTLQTTALIHEAYLRMVIRKRNTLRTALISSAWLRKRWVTSWSITRAHDVRTNEAAEPIVAIFLFGLGVFVLARFSFRRRERPVQVRPVSRGFLAPLGLIAGFLDAAGGGGWGPISTPTLLSSGRMEPRKIIGTVDTSVKPLRFSGDGEIAGVDLGRRPGRPRRRSVDRSRSRRGRPRQSAGGHRGRTRSGRR